MTSLDASPASESLGDHQVSAVGLLEPEPTPTEQQDSVPALPAPFPGHRTHPRSFAALDAAPLRRDRRADKDGKRWMRRKDNVRFAANPHIVPALPADLAGPPPPAHRPLPPVLARHLSAPSAVPARRDPSSALAGRFSLGLGGVRRTLRGTGPRSERLVRAVEGALLAWLDPAAIEADANTDPSDPAEAGIRPIARSPQELVWHADDAFARYVVHCCARFYGVVSFSKPTPDGAERHTHLLRPHVSRQDFGAVGLETPPTTDMSDVLSLLGDEDDETGSERMSTVLSDVELVLDVDATPRAPRVRDEADGASSLDGEGDDEGDDDALAWSIDSLAVVDQPRGMLTSRRDHATPRTAGRATSSPSRSPARRLRRRRQRHGVPRVLPVRQAGQLRFYQYVFG